MWPAQWASTWTIHTFWGWSCDPHPGTLFWHSFWHTIWKYTWHILAYSDILFGHIVCHSVWHTFWHICWHSGILWHSIWHLFWDSSWNLFRHSIWHLFRHSFSHSDIYSDILSGIVFGSRKLLQGSEALALWLGAVDGREGVAPLLKSRDPHLVGKKMKLILPSVHLVMLQATCTRWARSWMQIPRGFRSLPCPSTDQSWWTRSSKWLVLGMCATQLTGWRLVFVLAEYRIVQRSSFEWVWSLGLDSDPEVPHT